MYQPFEHLWTRLQKAIARLPIIAARKKQFQAQLASTIALDLVESRRDNLKQTLPENILAAFTLQPVNPEDPRFVGRESALASMLEGLQQWREKRASLTAVIGPHGAGITSLLYQLRSHIAPDEKCTYLSFPSRPGSAAEALRLVSAIFELEHAPETIAELVDRINQLPAQVVIIDDAHMLLARKMGNLAAVQTVGALLVATQHRHCWIVGCVEQAWRRLCFLYEADRFFGRVIELDYFTARELGEMIDVRLYGLGYQFTEREGLSRNEKDPLIDHLKLLHDRCGGQPELAFFLLLSSMVIDPKKQLIALDLMSTLDIKELKSCTAEELFSLAEIYVQGRMSRSEHDVLFGISSGQSFLRLERLRRLGLLGCKKSSQLDASDSYYLPSILASAAVSHLVNNNRFY